MNILDRLSSAWNAFRGNETNNTFYNANFGYSSSYRPDRVALSRGNERSIVTSVYNRISVDCTAINIRHIRLDENNRFIDEINSGLNNCLSVEANKDQTASAFIMDAVMSLLDEGCIAIVPVDTTEDPFTTNSYDIETMRVGRITQWWADNVKIEVFNDRKNRKEEIVMPKADVAIVENPFYAIMNGQNSTLQRLIRKLNILDAIDEQSGSGKLDLIIQLPYVIKTDARREQAEKRRKDIEQQLAGSKYGIAYTDGTEHITQLNRSVENNILAQIEYLTSMLYSQLSITQSILDGTADEKTMLNYMNRTVEPIVSAIVEEMNRKFLTRTARSQKQKIMYFNDPFRLISVTNIADIADKFTRNEIMSSNEIRQIIGMKPSSDPAADELRNKNLNKSVDEVEMDETQTQNGTLLKNLPTTQELENSD